MYEYGFANCHQPSGSTRRLRLAPPSETRTRQKTEDECRRAGCRRRPVIIYDHARQQRDSMLSLTESPRLVGQLLCNGQAAVLQRPARTRTSTDAMVPWVRVPARTGYKVGFRFYIPGLGKATGGTELLLLASTIRCLHWVPGVGVHGRSRQAAGKQAAISSDPAQHGTRTLYAQVCTESSYAGRYTPAPCIGRDE